MQRRKVNVGFHTSDGVSRYCPQEKKHEASCLCPCVNINMEGRRGKKNSSIIVMWTIKKVTIAFFERKVTETFLLKQALNLSIPHIREKHSQEGDECRWMLLSVLFLSSSGTSLASISALKQSLLAMFWYPTQNTLILSVYILSTA